MRKAFLQPASMHAGPNMTPLVDIVMVILIFLMLAGSFGSDSIFVETKLDDIGGPPPTAGPTVVIDTKPHLDIHVYTTPEGIDVMQMSGGEMISDTETLAARLKERRSQYAQNGRADDVHVIIRPAGDVAWQPVIGTYDAALQAEFKQVSFARAAVR